MNYTIINTSNGEILKTITCPEDQISGQYDALTQSCLEGTYSDENYYYGSGTFIAKPVKPEGFFQFNNTTKLWAPDSIAATISVTSQRRELLISSDWTQLPNSPLTIEQQEQWASYRQELRDISKQVGYLTNVLWPNKPY